MKDPDSRIIREFNDRGLIWILESTTNLRDLLRILSVEIADSLDFDKAVRHNRSFIPEDLYKKEADMLYKVPFLEGGGHVIIYLLIEHQSAPDRIMGLRFFGYMAEIWGEQLRLWQDIRSPKPPLTLNTIIPILLYTGEEAWKTPVSLIPLMNLPSLLEDFVPQYKILSLQLRSLSTEELTDTGSVFSWLLNTLKFSKAPFNELSEKIDLAVTALEKLHDSNIEEWKRGLRFLLLLIRHKRVKSERAPLFDQVSEAIDIHHRKEVADMILTDAQELMHEGEKLGLLKGREEGRQEGRQEGIMTGKWMGGVSFFFHSWNSNFNHSR